MSDTEYTGFTKDQIDQVAERRRKGLRAAYRKGLVAARDIVTIVSGMSCIDYKKIVQLIEKHDAGGGA